MTYAVPTDSTSRRTMQIPDLIAALGEIRASRRERVRARRTVLAMSEEARIHTQMRYRQMRYRHMAS